MQTITAIFGVLLSVLGLGSYVKTTRRHVTALFPLFIGLPMLALGVSGRDEEHSADAMHTTAGLSLVGLVVSLQGLLFPQLFPVTAEHPEAHPMRRTIQASTAVLSGSYLALAFKSFLTARR